MRGLQRFASNRIRAISVLEGLISSHQAASPSILRSLSALGDNVVQQNFPSSRLFRASLTTSSTVGSLEAEAAQPSQATYHVEVVTGDVRGAGSPTPAAIQLYGDGKKLHIPKLTFVTAIVKS